VAKTIIFHGFGGSWYIYLELQGQPVLEMVGYQLDDSKKIFTDWKWRLFNLEFQYIDPWPTEMG